MIDAESGVLLPLQCQVFSLKVGIFQAEDAVLNVVGGRPAHGEEGAAGQLKYLPPHQVEHVGPDGLHPAAVPVLYRVFHKGIVVFMVSRDEGHREGQPFQPVQRLVIPFISEPHAAEVSQLEHHILLR